MAASIASINRDAALDKVYEDIEKDLIVSFNVFLDTLKKIGNLSRFYYIFYFMLEQ